MSQIILKESEALSIGKHLHYLEDTSKVLSVDEVAKASGFQKSESAIPNIGFSKSAYWLKVVIDNQSGLSDWVMEIDYPNFDYIDFYMQDSAGSWQVKKMGDMLPFDSRPLPLRKFAIPLPEKTGIQTYYLRFLTNGVYVFPINLRRTTQLFSQEMKENLVYGTYYGLMLVMFLYNLLIFISLKEKSYLYYSLSIFAITFYILSLYHHGFQYFWKNSPVFHNYSLNISLGVWLIIVSLFAANFLELKRYSYFFHYSLRAIAIMGIVELLLIFLIDRGTLTRINAASIIIVSLILISGGGYALYRGNVAAKHFILAWSAFLIGALTYSLRSFGKLPNNFFTEHSVEIGSAIEVVLIAFALTAKYQELKRERDKAKAEAIA
ncbi:MAG: hypothetical protein NZ521_02585, partial [Flammeovirgaceae bacterium]|nr:hypothetical protein [Flammeovirgaceae bacterium]MDW8287365.1 7TM diverse intracellular signaling domain-containing protein [Flammeovirgaceae bacterium]